MIIVIEDITIVMEESHITIMTVNMITVDNIKTEGVKIITKREKIVNMIKSVDKKTQELLKSNRMEMI
jgi:hypothetical protein